MNSPYHAVGKRKGAGMDGRCSRKLKLPRKFMWNYRGKTMVLSYFIELKKAVTRLSVNKDLLFFQYSYAS